MTNQNSTTIKFYSGEQIPVELHKVRVVQKLHLRPIDERAKAMEAAGFNTFLLDTKGVFGNLFSNPNSFRHHKKGWRRPQKQMFSYQRYYAMLGKFNSA